MTSVSIIVLFLVIGGFIGFAIFVQLKERARLAKLRQSASLNNQLRQVRKYLDEMPPQYQPKDMRLWLFSRMLAIYDELLEAQPDAALTRRRAQLVEEISTFKKSKQKRRAKPINDEVLIVDVKRLFDSFKSFMIVSEKDGNISSDLVHRYSQLLHFFQYKVNADYHGYLARKAFLSGQMETALEMYKEALSQLGPIKDSVEAKSAILKITDVIREIEDDLALQNEENEKANQEGGEGLDDEWSKFIDDSSFQEKKRF